MLKNSTSENISGESPLVVALIAHQVWSHTIGRVLALRVRKKLISLIVPFVLLSSLNAISPASAASTILGTTVGGPVSITIDSAGNIYTANFDSNTVSKITPAGVSSILGTTGTSPDGITIDSAGNIYTPNIDSNTVSKITPTGVSSILGTTGAYPNGITIDSAGNIYTANYSSNNVSKITPTGVSSILGTTGTGPVSITIDSARNIYTANYHSNNVSKITQVTTPDAPTIGAATALSPTSASISFTAPISDGGATIETYTVTSTPGSITGRVLQAGSGSITVTGLTASTAYTFRVTASNNVGTSSASSATVSITMPASAEELAAQAAALASVKAAAELAAAEAAAAKREAEKQAARSDITSKSKSAKDLTVDAFARAEISGITASNIAAVQAELLALPEASRTDIQQVLKVAYKYEIVGNIGSDRINYVQSNSFIEIGLIPATSKNKLSLVYSVRKLPEASRDTYAKIKAAIDAAASEIQARSDRLAAAIARNAPHYPK